MQREQSLKLTPQLVIGMALVVFGILLMLDRLHIVDAAVGLRFWPVALIATGAALVLERRGGSSFPGFVLIGVGALLLVGSVMRVSVWSLVFPVLIIVIGARLIAQTSRAASPRPAAIGAANASATPSSSSGWVSVLSVLGEAKRASSDRPFRGGDLTSFMGSVQLDLRRAVIEPGETAVISVMGMMSAQELWVPTEWTVSLEVAPVLGEVGDKRMPPIEGALQRPASPRLVVKGVMIMGGLTIKS